MSYTGDTNMNEEDGRIEYKTNTEYCDGNQDEYYSDENIEENDIRPLSPDTEIESRTIDWKFSVDNYIKEQGLDLCENLTYDLIDELIEEIQK